MFFNRLVKINMLDYWAEIEYVYLNVGGKKLDSTGDAK